MNNREKIIKFLNKEQKNNSSYTLRIDKNDISELHLPENEVINILLQLNDDGIIVAKPESPHKDFSACWKIHVKTECLEYFHNKKRNRINNRRDWIRTYIPIIISILSLTISIVSLAITLSNRV